MHDSGNDQLLSHQPQGDSLTGNKVSSVYIQDINWFFNVSELWGWLKLDSEGVSMIIFLALLIVGKVLLCCWIPTARKETEPQTYIQANTILLCYSL